MNLDDGPVVAFERLFKTRCDGTEVAIPVEWFVPQSDAQDWSCAYVIRWPDRHHSHGRAYGVDGLQAVQMAQAKVALELYGAEPPVYWLEENDRLGLYLVPLMRDLEDGRKTAWEDVECLKPK